MIKVIKPMKDRKALNDKEQRILQLICEQLSSKQIAAEMNIPYRTVEKYRTNIMLKTGALNTAGLVVYAIKNGIYKINS